MKIGEKLRHLRELRNLSQQSLAGAMGISQPHYSRIEKGAEITYSQLEKAANEMGISVEDIIAFNVAQYFKKANIDQIQYHVDLYQISNELKEVKKRLERLEAEKRRKMEQ
ncbi:MAG: helix-turn-helix transcriptional regulator [Bacteroidota bacterium]